MNPNPRILAFDTSGRTGSVLLATGSQILHEQILPPTSRHAIELVPTIHALLQKQNWNPADLDQIHLSLGPGSFTGLRIAVAFARAFTQAAPQVKLVGVPTLDAMAQNADGGGGEFDTVIPVLDAKRGQIFTARYERQSAGGLSRTTEQQLAEPATFFREALNHSPSERVALLGEGLDYHRSAIPQDGHFVELPKDLWPSRASAVLKLGLQKAQRKEFTPLEQLLPIYIRLPEAEELYRRKHGLPI